MADMRESLVRAEKALDWLEDRFVGQAAHSISLFDSGTVCVRVEVDESEDGFVLVARAIGATRVSTVAGGSGLHASIEPAPALRFWLVAGAWWDEVPADKREAVAEKIRADVLAVVGHDGPFDPCGCPSTVVDFEGHRLGCEKHNPWGVANHCEGCAPKAVTA